MKARWTRRMIGLLKARLAKLGLDDVDDPRCRHGRWSLEAVLRAVIVGMIAGAKSLRDLESLTDEMSVAARRALRLPGRLPDTTARDLLVRVSPQQLQSVLARQVLAAHRRRALSPEAAPWGVLSVDGKDTTIRAWDEKFAQKQGKLGHLRTMTSTLVSSGARVCAGASPIPPPTNEMGHYQTAIQELLDNYTDDDLFRVLMYDSGGCSEANARWTRSKHLHYVMVLNDGQPTLYQEARRVLGSLSEGQGDIVETKDARYTLWRTTKLKGWLNWDHLTCVIRIRREALSSKGAVTQTGERYFITSLRSEALDTAGWAALLRARWGVENNTHHILDTVFDEDDKTWINTDPQGALNILLLRRIALNMLTIFRGRTLRTESTRNTPWADLIRRTYNALISATAELVADLRPRRPPPRLAA